MTADIAGRVAFVTGASRGIGRACALALSEEGTKVAVGFRNDKDGALDTAAGCPDSLVIQIDVRDPESVAAAFDEIEKGLGPVEILVNNAGMTKDALLIRMSENDWQDVIDTDLSGVFRCSKRALRSMLRSGWGRVITIGSVVGSVGNAGQANYAAAKAGVVGFTKALAREVARHGVTANVVTPGYVETELTAVLPEAAKEALLNRIPLARPAEPEEVAEAVRFCARNAYVTGQVIAVDGGLS